MKTLRTLLAASALVLGAGAANAAPATGLGTVAGTETADSAVAQAYHFYPGYRRCGYRFGFHYHPFHGLHYGPSFRCFRPYWGY